LALFGVMCAACEKSVISIVWLLNLAEDNAQHKVFNTY
jgi:hypothetical protein